MSEQSEQLIQLARELGERLDSLSLSDPVAYVYNAYDYAMPGVEAFARRFGSGSKRVVYLGMNPGPWGMAQTGVPFGEIAAVRDWMGIEAEIGKPRKEHPKRPIEGFACQRSEVSGRRLWGLFAELYGSAEAFFEHSFALNYCPLSFMAVSGANITPDKLAVAERKPLEEACDAHLRAVLKALQPKLAIGVGGFATKRLERLGLEEIRIGTLLHPSPASPIANREWPHRPRTQLKELGVI